MKIKASSIQNHLGAGRAIQNSATHDGGDINIYEPQTMQPAFNKRMPVTTFLRDTFFPSDQTFPTKHVLMDFKKNQQTVAPLVAEGSKPVNIRRQGYQTKIYTAPFINLSAPYDVDFLQARLPGETVFGGMTPEQRALVLMQQDFADLDDMVTRREELMAAQLMQTGTVTLTGFVDDTATEVRTDTINFQFDNIVNLIGGDQWNQSTSKKYEDLLAAVSKVRRGGYNPTMAILGEKAWANLRQDSDFMNQYMDLRYAQFGSINPQLNLQNGNGYMYIGRLTELGIDLYQYIAHYYDDTDKELKPFIEPNKVIVGSQNTGEMLFGAITMIPEDSNNFVTIESARASKVVVNRENDTKSLIVKSRPVPKPYDVASWAVINTVQEQEG